MNTSTYKNIQVSKGNDRRQSLWVCKNERSGSDAWNVLLEVMPQNYLKECTWQLLLLLHMPSAILVTFPLCGFAPIFTTNSKSASTWVEHTFSYYLYHRLIDQMNERGEQITYQLLLQSIAHLVRNTHGLVASSNLLMTSQPGCSNHFLFRL